MRKPTSCCVATTASPSPCRRTFDPGPAMQSSNRRDSVKASSLALACLAMLGLCAFLAGSPRDPDVKVRLRLVDADTGKLVGGMVRLKDAESGAPISPKG